MEIKRATIGRLFEIGTESYIGQVMIERDEDGKTVTFKGYPILNIIGIDLQTNDRVIARVKRERVSNYSELFQSLKETIECSFFNTDKKVGSKKTAVIRKIRK